MFQADVFTIAGWIPGASTMTSLEEVRAKLANESYRFFFER